MTEQCEHSIGGRAASWEQTVEGQWQVQNTTTRPSRPLPPTVALPILTSALMGIANRQFLKFCRRGEYMLLMIANPEQAFY